MILYNPYTKEKFEAELIGEEDDMYICKDETGKEFRWLKEYAIKEDEKNGRYE